MTTQQAEAEITRSAADRSRRAAMIIIAVRITVAGLLLSSLITGAIFFPVAEWFEKALEWTQQLGIWGPVFVVAFYVIACVLFLPGSVLTLGAGFVFKVVIGTITVSVGSTLGACAAFLVGRTLARDWISSKVAGSEKFSAIDEAVGKQGFKIVLLTRLSPVFPFNLLNYAFGLTKVSFWKYALASWIGMLPGTVMYVYFGAGARSLADAAAGTGTGTARTISLLVGIVVAVAVAVLVARVARKAIREAVGDGSAEQ